MNMNLITERSDKSLINKTTVTYLLVVVFVLLIKVGLKAQSPPFASDCSRTVMAFDGTDDYLDVQGTTIDGNAGTWEAWVRKSNWASQTNGILFGNDIAFSTTNTMYLSFHSAVGLHFRYGDNTNEPTTGGAIYGQFTNGFAADSWHHIAVTWAHVSGTTTLQMFVDGVKQSGFASGSRQTHNALIDPGSSLNFGFSQGENYLEAGALAEIRTWSVVRTEAEIQSAMNTVLTGMESGLTGYWPLDEASGTTAASNSVSGAPDANLTNADENTVWETLSNVKIAVSQEGMALDHQDSFDFGMVESGESVTKTFTITNQGSTTLSLNGSPIIVVDGADATEVVADASATSSSLAAGASTTFDLTFTAGDTGSKAASISIATDDTCLPAFELNLTGESVVTTKPDAITVSDASPCLNETITLTAVGGNIFGDTEWVWYEGDASGAPLGTGTSIDVTPQRSARYLVLAEDAGTPLTDFTVSETVTLSTETVIQVDQQPASSVVATGNTHSLIVRASGSGLTYQWQKDGVDLVDGSNVTGTQTAELSFAAVTGADDGIYRCIISNSCNTQTSGDASLVTTSDAYVTLPLFEDFESADGGFTASNLKGPTTWEYGTSAGGANSGTEVWETDLDGIIQNNEINVLISPNYLLSPELAGAELSFALNYDLTLFQQSGTPVTDRWFQAAELNISTDNGANWTKITDFEEGGYSRSSGFIFNDANLDWPLWTDNSGGWITARVNLADYVGQEVQFRIIVSTTSGFAGWFFGSGMKIDDWGISELDNIAPTASFEISDGATDNSAKEVQLTFSEEVSFALADLEVANGTLSNLQTTDNQNYTFDVTPVTDGFVAISINEAVDPIEDLNGNQLANAPELTFLSDNANSEVFIYTTEDPVFSSFTADIVFSKPVSNFEVGDISATNAGLAKLQTTDNINFTVEVTPAMTGTVTLNIPAMVAEDQFGNFNDASETVSLNFNPASAPVLDPIGDQSVDEETELTFTASATDLNQDEEITYSLDATSLGKGMTIDVMAGTFSWTPSESQDGDHTVTITATDDSSGALSDEETITITVNEVNQNPTVTVGPAVWHIPEDAYASRSYQIDDPDGHEVTIELDDDAVARGFGLLNVNNPVVNKLVFWTAPLEVEETSFDVTLTVTDDFGGLTEFVITINLQEVNQLPALNTIGDQTTDEMTELAFTVSGTDADLPAQSLSYSISDGELTGMSIDSETGEFSWTPAEDQDGTHTVTFAISDDFAPDAGVTSEEITITVNETNQSPVLAAVGDQSGDELAELTFTAVATDADDPTNTLAYSIDATSVSKRMSIDSETGEFSWTPTESQDGDHTVTITVTDDGNGSLSDEETITITINEVNQNPTVTVGPAVWDIPEDAYASRSYQIDDPDGHEVTIELDDDAVARGFGLLNVNNPVVNKLVFWTAPLEVEETSFDVTLTVTDDFGGLTEFVITINLQEVNQLPALNTIGDQTTDEMTELAFTVSGTDADLPAQSLSYSISDGELTGMSIDSETGEFSWTPAEDQDGTHTVTFAISDDFAPDAGVTTEEMTITVNETNQSPVLGPVGDQLVDERAELTFTVTATDPDTPANELAFALDATAESKGMTIDESTGEFSWTPTEAQDGDHTVTITVTDNGAGLLTDDETITITVNELPNTWNGSVWSDGVAPTGEDVQIDDDYNLSTSGSFTANNLMVNAQLMVDGGETLIVNNELVNNGSLMIESGSSLITYASGSFSGDPVIAERITRHADGKYSFVGTPFEQSSDNTGDDLGTIVFQYDESVAYQPDDGLGRWLGLNDAQLIPGKGYAQAGQQTLTYSGTPNTGTINFTGTYTGTYNDGVDEQTEGWNLIANPYPAAIEVQAFLDENTNLEGAVYLWDDNGSDVARGTNADYVVANGTVATNTTPAGGQGRYNGHIGSSQGFFVKLADDTDTEISFTEAMRTAGSNADGNFFRDAQPAYVRVNLSGSEGFFKQLIIGRVQGISDTEIDRSFDARVFEESANAFYSLKGGEALAIQGLSAREEVPLGYALPENGRYVIGIEADKFGGEPIFLYDAELDITTNLNEDVYEFSANSGVAKDRFQLLLKPAVVTEVSGHQVAEFYSYSSENQLKVFLRSTVETTVSANLINLNGRVVLTAHQRNSDEEMTIDTSHLPKGVYVLQVSGKTFSGKRKVIVR